MLTLFAIGSACGFADRFAGHENHPFEKLAIVAAYFVYCSAFPGRCPECAVYFCFAFCRGRPSSATLNQNNIKFDIAIRYKK